MVKSLILPFAKGRYLQTKMSAFHYSAIVRMLLGFTSFANVPGKCVQICLNKRQLSLHYAAVQNRAFTCCPRTRITLRSMTAHSASVQDRALHCSPRLRIRLLSRPRNGLQYRNAHSAVVLTAQWTVIQDCAFSCCSVCAFHRSPGPRVRPLFRPRNGLQSWTVHSAVAQTAQGTTVMDCAFGICPYCAVKRVLAAVQIAQWTAVQDRAFGICPILRNGPRIRLPVRPRNARLMFYSSSS